MSDRGPTIAIVIIIIGLLGWGIWGVYDIATIPTLPAEPPHPSKMTSLNPHFATKHYAGPGTRYDAKIIFNDIFNQIDSLKARIDSLERKTRK